jgi:hypothetical protein
LLACFKYIGIFHLRVMSGGVVACIGFLRSGAGFKNAAAASIGAVLKRNAAPTAALREFATLLRFILML